MSIHILPEVQFRRGEAKYAQLHKSLKEKIFSGKIGVRTQLPSEAVMAQKFSVSVSTVRQAMDILERDGLINRIHGKGTFVCDINRPVARDSKTASGLLACVVGDMSWVDKDYPSMIQLFRGFHKIIDNSIYNLSITGLANGNEGMENNRILGIFEPGSIAGLLISAQQLPVEEILKLEHFGTPAVLFNMRAPSPFFLSVSIDTCKAVYDVMNHLINLGHSRIAILNSKNNTPIGTERLAGYRAALLNAKLPFVPPYVWEVDYAPELANKAIMGMLELSLEKRPTAILVSDDVIGKGVIEFAENRGLRIPEDLSIVSCTGFSGINSGKVISSVHMPLEKMSSIGAKMLIDRLSGREIDDTEVVLPAELCEGETICPPEI